MAVYTGYDEVMAHLGEYGYSLYVEGEGYRHGDSISLECEQHYNYDLKHDLNYLATTAGIKTIEKQYIVENTYATTNFTNVHKAVYFFYDIKFDTTPLAHFTNFVLAVAYVIEDSPTARVYTSYITVNKTNLPRKDGTGRAYWDGEHWTNFVEPDPQYYGGAIGMPGIYFEYGYTPGDQQSCDMSYKCDAYVFKNLDDATRYLHGEDVEPITPEEPDTEPKQHYYYYCKATKNNSFLFRREMVITCDTDVKVVGYYLPSENLPTNIKFISKPSNATIELKNTNINVNGIKTWETNYTAITGGNGLYMGEKKQSLQGVIYYATVDTNIKIYDNEQDALDGLDNDDTGGETENDTGEEIDSQDLPTPDMYLPLCHAHVLSETQMQTLANVIYTSDQTIMEQILEGLQMYGNNPIDFFINAYAVPFDPRVFCTYEDVQSMYFGSYTASVPNSAISTNNKLLEIANTYINGSYHDWRDYETRYYIYLPYCGMQILDTEKYLYKTLTIKMAYDIRTGNIKYYFFANSKLLDTYEGSCGVNMALMSTNTASKAWDIVSNVVGTTGNVIDLASKKGSVGTGITSILNTTKEFVTDAQKHLSGNQSPSTAVFDMNYVYLIIESPEFQKSPNLENVFGKPDGNVNVIGNYSGYIEVINTQLKTSATEQERDEILSLLEKGVVI